jgi:hypothetical protein
MRIKPTKRKDGLYRCTLRVPAHIDIFDIINAMIYYRVNFDKALPTSRQKAMRMALDHFQESGSNAWATVPADAQEEEGGTCAIQAVRLFPDLAQGVDLSGYQIDPIAGAEEQPSGASMPQSEL